MKFKRDLLLAILLTVLLIGCSDSKPEDESAKNSADSKSAKYQDIVLETTDKKSITVIESKETLDFKELRGKVVLINFFATWCPPCKAEVPHLNNLRKKFDGKFEVVGVLLEKNKTNDVVQEFIDTYNVTYPITNSFANFELAELFGGISSIPTMFLFNKDGRMIQKYVGMVPEEMLESDIKLALK